MGREISHRFFWMVFITCTSQVTAASAASAINYSLQNTLTGVTSALQNSANNGAGILFGVIDTGIAAPWVGFQNRIDTVKSVCLLANCTKALALKDDNGHGSFVTSEIIGSVPSIGMSGVAPGAKALAIKVLDATGSGYSTTLAAGMIYAVDHGAQVLNLSVGPVGPALAQALFYQSLSIAVNYAASKNAVIVFAGGNSGQALAAGANVSGYTDAALQHMMFVGSTNGSKAISSFSNKPGSAGFISTTGKFYAYKDMWLLADGENIWGASNYSTPEYGYSYIRQMSGTSMAAPQVAGAAGLLAARWPFLLAQGTIPAILEKTAQDMGAAGIDNTYGAGFLRIDSSMNPIGALTIPVGGKMVAVTGSQIIVGNALGNMGQVSSALQNAVAYDSYMRGFSILMPVSIVSKGETSPVSKATLLAMKRTAAGQRQFTELADGNWLSFSGSPSSSGSGQTQSSPWSYGFSEHGRFIGFGQGSGAALSFNDARWGGENAFTGMDTSASGALLGLVSNGSFSSFGMDLNSRGHFAVSFLTTGMNADDPSGDDSLQATGGALAYTFKPSQSLKVSVTSSMLSEKNMLLGSSSSGAFSLGSATQSESFGLGVNIALSRGWALGFDGAYALTDSSGSGGSLISDTSRLAGYSFTLGLVNQNLTGIHDSFGVSVAKPLRVYSGSVDLTVPTGTDMNAQPIVSHVRVGLAPSGNETDFSLDYLRPFGPKMTGGLNVAYRNDADNIAGAKDFAAMYRFKLAF
jgi:hypothetical protein